MKCKIWNFGNQRYIPKFHFSEIPKSANLHFSIPPPSSTSDTSDLTIFFLNRYHTHHRPIIHPKSLPINLPNQPLHHISKIVLLIHNLRQHPIHLVKILLLLHQHLLKHFFQITSLNTQSELRLKIILFEQCQISRCQSHLG